MNRLARTTLVSLLLLLAGSPGCGDDAVTGAGSTTDGDAADDVVADGDVALDDLGGTDIVTPGCIDHDRDGHGEGCSLGFDCNDNTSAVFEGAEEQCDFIDNNCNDLVDEGCPCPEGAVQSCYTGPLGTLGAGRCAAGWQQCEDGEWGGCTSELTPRDETCDGLDNNCNGEIDEGLTNACGLCGTLPDEVCLDGLDNDCDGTIDGTASGCSCEERTNQTCYSGPPHTLGVGVCRGGTFDCVADEWTACEGEVLPTTEVCDGQDNDCDGLVDEGLVNSCGQCGAENPREVCDGADNDCDGSVDEGLQLVCGLCSAEGLEEVCGDGLDNDCDNDVDEGCACEGDPGCYPGPESTRGIGACSDGSRSCDPGGEFWGACEGFVLPKPETCNGEDDDCDGLTDVSPLGCDLCARNVETCDFVDNDCDGAVDEFLRNACGECIDQVEPETECDGIDNDCDGLIDEGLLNACGYCGDSCYLQGWGTDEGNLDEGDSNGLSSDVSEGLMLGVEPYVYPYLWVANSLEDTVSRINTEDPAQPVQTMAVGDSPSRTAVDLDGNVWVANRGLDTGVGSVTKILAENETGVAEELFTRTIGGNSDLPRGLAIDADNNAWVGTYNNPRIFQLRNSDGGILFETEVDVPVYGLAIDSEGTLWIASLSGKLGQFDTVTRRMIDVYPNATYPSPGCLTPYGVAVDGNGHVWLGNWTCDGLVQFVPGSGFQVHNAPGSTMDRSRGVAVDDLGNVWVSGYLSSRVGRFTPSTGAWVTESTCSGPIGIGVTASGTVWTPCYGSDNVSYFDLDAGPLGTVDVGDGPYSYSDMTGFQLRTFTARVGTWTVTYDCGWDLCTFDSIEWDAETPAGSEVQVRARSSLNATDWSPRVGAFTRSPANLAALPDGRYLELEVTLRAGEDDISPVVQGIDVNWQRP